jgi:alpha-1,3-rhamnosyl/mannosyltransferase
MTANEAARPTKPSGLRVGVNLMWCIPGQVGGSEQYLVRQLLGLREARADVDITMYGSLAFDAAHPELEAVGRFVVAPIDGRRRWRRIISETRWLRNNTASRQLIHHGGGTAPLRARQPYVLTIHDLQYRTYPQYFSSVKRRYLDMMVPRSALDAAVVTVPSDYVRGTVIEHLGVAESRVRVVPHGYEPALLSARTSESVLRRTLGLGAGPVLVYPAITHPHKNHRFLVDLLSGPWDDPSLRLVLLGGAGVAEDDLMAAIGAAGAAVADRIVRPGRVCDADRNGLLAMAAAMVFPSMYEGFGAPVIEAMALGTPVICSDVTCLPGIAGDAAVMRPLSVDAWADALDEVEARRDELIAAGRHRVQEFTSYRSGQALHEAYLQAVET